MVPAFLAASAQAGASTSPGHRTREFFTNRAELVRQHPQLRRLQTLVVEQGAAVDDVPGAWTQADLRVRALEAYLDSPDLQPEAARTPVTYLNHWKNAVVRRVFAGFDPARGEIGEGARALRSREGRLEPDFEFAEDALSAELQSLELLARAERAIAPGDLREHDLELRLARIARSLETHAEATETLWRPALRAGLSPHAEPVVQAVSARLDRLIELTLRLERVSAQLGEFVPSTVRRGSAARAALERLHREFASLEGDFLLRGREEDLDE